MGKGGHKPFDARQKKPRASNCLVRAYPTCDGYISHIENKQTHVL